MYTGWILRSLLLKSHYFYRMKRFSLQVESMLLYFIALTNVVPSLFLLECGHRLRVLPKCFHINISAHKLYHSLRTILQFTNVSASKFASYKDD